MIYYQDEHVTLHHGDSLEILPTLDLQASALLTDPPYFKVKKDAWDNQWGGADQFLGWMGSWLDLAKPLLAANASAWVFASPAMTSAVERVVGQRFRVLNSVRWVKRAGWHNKAELDTLRSFLTPWEGVIFAEQFADEYADQAKALHKQVFAPLGRYIQEERERAGLSRTDLASCLSGYKNLDSATANVSNWELGKNLIGGSDYEAARSAMGQGFLLRTHASLRREYEDLRRVYEDLRRPFTITDRALSTDIWDFPTVKPYKGRHPCEKPAEMLRHMIETSTREGDLILDPFAGSGSTLEAARSLGRRAVGIEQDEHWCEQIALKLSAETLDMEEAA